MKIGPHLKKNLGLNEVNQIGIVVKDIEKAISNYSDFFGIVFPKVFVPEYFNKIYRGKPADFRIKIAFGMMGVL